jgi:hypothetical protein
MSSVLARPKVKDEHNEKKIKAKENSSFFNPNDLVIT